MNNIQVVDDVVRETESLFSSFYDDSETAFVFTADHGMSKIGNHGDGGDVIYSYSFVTTNGVMKCQTPTTLVPL